jgi:integrase
VGESVPLARPLNRTIRRNANKPTWSAARPHAPRPPVSTRRNGGTLSVGRSSSAWVQRSRRRLLAAYTGLRAGELRALRRGDVSFARATVTVSRSWSADELTSPKSRRPRAVPLATRPAVDPAVGTSSRAENPSKLAVFAQCRLDAEDRPDAISGPTSGPINRKILGPPRHPRETTHLQGFQLRERRGANPPMTPRIEIRLWGDRPSGAGC